MPCNIESYHPMFIGSLGFIPMTYPHRWVSPNLLMKSPGSGPSHKGLNANCCRTVYVDILIAIYYVHCFWPISSIFIYHISQLYHNYPNIPIIHILSQCSYTIFPLYHISQLYHHFINIVSTHLLIESPNDSMKKNPMPSPSHHGRLKTQCKIPIWLGPKLQHPEIHSICAHVPKPPHKNNTETEGLAVFLPVSESCNASKLSFNSITNHNWNLLCTKPRFFNQSPSPHLARDARSTVTSLAP